MSRKLIKQLRKELPNLTQEQIDAFDAFYKTVPQDAFKTFDTEEEFKKYVDNSLEEKTSELKTKINEFQEKEKEKKVADIVSKLGLSDQKAEALQKMTDISEIVEGEDFEKQVTAAFNKSMENFKEIFSTEDSGNKKLVNTSSDIFGEPQKAEKPKTSEIFE